ncbi:M61 family metallopeptidase [Terriglobus albidus]|uniref:M61 family metallopeptidase n=1 Tax=Terriglobus albidus TaxID=1592106 RepID=UPI0021DF5657|nr:M61 family peptidase [Terriglobus albidus]
MHFRCALALLALPLSALAADKKTVAKTPEAPSAPIRLSVDLTDSYRHLVHGAETIPVTAGALTLEYPEWIPGTHMPAGPIAQFAGIFFTANGKPLGWRRDDVDMYAFHLEIPAGVSEIEAKFDYLDSTDQRAFTSNNLAVLEWNTAVLYPAKIPVAKIKVTPSITLPAGWHGGGALVPANTSGNTITFETTDVETLVDSPYIAGKYFHEIPLAPECTPKHFLDVAADTEEAANLPKATIEAASKLVRETRPLYKSSHYRDYHFVLSLSDKIRGEGLEHHQSSDNGVELDGYSNPALAVSNADLLPHEFTHSWNGKYRRPARLYQPDYATPEQGDLLWVYEGMTQYWGNVLAARAGFWTAENYRDALASSAASLDTRPGRRWRNTEDTAIAAQSIRGGSQAWVSWRRSQDYYQEGELIWLDADTTIRRLTNDQKSLNDFAALFLGAGGDTPAKVLPYDFDELVKDLNQVVAYDWAKFLKDRILSHGPGDPSIEGLAQGGYKLVYTDTMSSYQRGSLSRRGTVDALYSLGFRTNREGVISDVYMDSVAYNAGLGPGIRIVGVNSTAFSGDALYGAIKAAKGTDKTIDLLVAIGNDLKTISLNYHDGEKYPHLVRAEGTPGYLDEIIKPMTN